MWSSGVARLFGCLSIMLHCLVCVPSGRGDFFVFCSMFCLPSVGQGSNEHHLFVIVILCVPTPSNLCLAREGLHGPPPLYHFGFGAVAASLQLTWCAPCYSCNALLFVHTMHKQWFTHFWPNTHRLLHAIACNVNGKVCWSVPTP